MTDQYEIVEYRGTKIRLASPQSLLKLKKDTHREKDKMDVLFLKELCQKKT